MDDLASAIRNYGSFSSDSGNVNNGDVPNDVTLDSLNQNNKYVN